MATGWLTSADSVVTARVDHAVQCRLLAFARGFSPPISRNAAVQLLLDQALADVPPVAELPPRRSRKRNSPPLAPAAPADARLDVEANGIPPNAQDVAAKNPATMGKAVAAKRLEEIAGHLAEHGIDLGVKPAKPKQSAVANETPAPAKPRRRKTADPGFEPTGKWRAPPELPQRYSQLTVERWVRLRFGPGPYSAEHAQMLMAAHQQATQYGLKVESREYFALLDALVEGASK
jgi:hypothetical protein